MGKAVDSRRRRHRGTSHIRLPLIAAGTLLGIALWGPKNMAAPAPVSPDGPSGGVAPDLPGLAGTPSTPGEQEEPDDPGDLLGRGHRTWKLVQGRHWQIANGTAEDPQVTDAREGTRGTCPAGMVAVAGKMRLHSMMDELQMQACTKWIDRKWPERCGEFDRDKWLKLAKDLPTQSMDFCIDRFEYPNRKGDYPVIMVSWYEARDMCKASGKRLCTEDEWTFACEGEETTPYPNGYVRDPNGCVADRPWKKFHGGALIPRNTNAAREELDRLWQGQPSGSRDACRSSFGVYDLTGNVDEWTHSSVGGERKSVLKGGYWGPVRTRCRPATRAHDETHTFYQQGFRCCSDKPAAR